VFAASKDSNVANSIYTTNTKEATQVNSTNSSDLILFIIVADLIQNGADLEYI
jgi:hypothetical protein